MFNQRAHELQWAGGSPNMSGEEPADDVRIGVHVDDAGGLAIGRAATVVLPFLPRVGIRAGAEEEDDIRLVSVVFQH